MSIAAVLEEFENTGKLGVPVRPARPHSDLLERTSPLVQHAVRRFVVGRQSREEITYARHVRDEILVGRFGLDVSESTARRLMRQLGLVATDEDGQGEDGAWHEKHYVRLDRWNYLSAVADANLFRQFVLWQDESFVYQHATKHHLSWIDPHLPHTLPSGGRRLNVMGIISDTGNVLVDTFVVCEAWRLREVEGQQKLELLPHYVRQVDGRVAQSASASAQTPAEPADAEAADDMADFLARYVSVPAATASKKRRTTRSAVCTLDDIALAHLEFCLEELIVPICRNELVKQLQEHGVVDEQDQLIDHIALKLQPKVREVALCDDIDVPEFVTDADFLISCCICDIPLACDADIDLICCEKCAQRDGRTYGLKLAANSGDEPLGSAHRQDADPSSSGPSRVADGGDQATSASTSNTYLTADFVEFWFEHVVLPALVRAHLAGGLLVFDLASIHLRLRDGTTISDLKKSRKNAAAFLTKHRIDVAPHMRKEEVMPAGSRPGRRPNDASARAGRRCRSYARVLADTSSWPEPNRVLVGARQAQSRRRSDRWSEVWRGAERDLPPA